MEEELASPASGSCINPTAPTPSAPPEDAALTLQCVFQPPSHQADRFFRDFRMDFDLSSHPTCSELRDPTPSPRPVWCCLLLFLLSAAIPVALLAEPPPMSTSGPDPSPEAQTWAPQHLPGTSNSTHQNKPTTWPPTSFSAVPWLGERPPPSASGCPAPQPQTQVVTHVPSCLPAISTCTATGTFNAHGKAGLPTPELLLPVCPAQQMAALSFQLLRANPWSHSWVLFLLPPYTPIHPRFL